MARNLRRVLGGLLLLGLFSGSLVVHPGVSASAVSDRSVGSVGGGAGGLTEQEPTSVELERQRAQVARLRAEAERRAAGVDDAQQALHGAAVLAGQALEEYALTVRELHARQQVERQSQDALTLAQWSVDASRRELGQWARQAYTNGSALGGSVTVTTLLLADNAEDVGTNLTALRRIGRGRTRTLAGMQAAQQRADVASEAATIASEAAAEAAVAASAAKQASEQAVNVQRRLLGVAESSLAQSNDDVSAATAREAGLRAALLAQAQAAEAARAAVPVPGTGSGASKDNRVTGQVGTCTGATVEQYANGQIPMAALCPLRSGAGHHLRADAAYAFDRMSQAYANRFGSTICLTDSYRSYAAQVSVFARKPGLAAVPGTSNHGWGTAVDLCGGIQSFSSPQHRWMRENASLYGWFHPGWAQQNGSKPEPWHWEYGG